MQSGCGWDADCCARVQAAAQSSSPAFHPVLRARNVQAYQRAQQRLRDTIATGRARTSLLPECEGLVSPVLKSMALYGAQSWRVIVKELLSGKQLAGPWQLPLSAGPMYGGTWAWDAAGQQLMIYKQQQFGPSHLDNDAEAALMFLDTQTGSCTVARLPGLVLEGILPLVFSSSRSWLWCSITVPWARCPCQCLTAAGVLCTVAWHLRMPACSGGRAWHLLGRRSPCLGPASLLEAADSASSGSRTALTAPCTFRE